MELVKTFMKRIELKTKCYEALNSLDLEKGLKNLKVNSCLGVVSKSMLRQILSLEVNHPYSFIFNLDDPEGAGSHWVAIGVKQNDVYYFDSYGDSYPPEEAKIKGLNVFRNLDVFQTPKDPPICGHLCLIFCLLFHITKGDAIRVLEEFKAKDTLIKYVCNDLI